jgi:hypothetical protein
MVDPGDTSEVPDWLTAVAIAIAICILIVVFTWIVVQLEPVMSDFIATDTAQPTVTPPDD